MSIDAGEVARPVGRASMRIVDVDVLNEVSVGQVIPVGPEAMCAAGGQEMGMVVERRS